MTEQLPADDESAHITIESDSLLIGAVGRTFRLPKQAVDELVSSLLITGFGPQTPAQFNTILTFQEMKKA